MTVVRALVLVAALLAAPSCSWAREPVTADASVIEPLPDGLELVDAGTYPCRGSGDSGWVHEYLVVLGDDGEPGGILHSHLRASGLALRPSGRSDWVVTVGTGRDLELRLGPLERWRRLDGPLLEGPTTSQIEDAVGDWTGPAAVIGLQPVDVTCEI